MFRHAKDIFCLKRISRVVVVVENLIDGRTKQLKYKTLMESSRITEQYISRTSCVRSAFLSVVSCEALEIPGSYPPSKFSAKPTGHSFYMVNEDIQKMPNIKAEFVSVLTELKAQAQNNHDIDIGSATVAIPQFFNSTLAGLVWTACWEAEISLPRGPQDRTVLATFNQSQETQIDNPDIRYLVLDLGEFYLDSRTYNTDKRAGMREGYLPMDQWGTESIDRYLTRRLVKGSEALRFQISLGARESDLWERVKQARLIKRNHAENQTSENYKYQDEWPLDLSGWGYQEFEEVKAVLTWKDIRVVEKNYVESLADNITHKDDGIPQRIDKLVILTAGHDGHLVKTAVQQALGDQIDIIGGTVHDSGLAAIGAARSALGEIQKQVWTKYQGWIQHDEI
ncbi:hypothetical protein GB937_009486 [Aspergillus fischeri]|nr:hypothetical protein GB937_009486 [Aspergillus fischeri]